MKIITGRSILTIAAGVLLLAGCSTTKQTESMLTAAGFKLVPATTPQQQAHLQTLPAGKLTKVIRNGDEWVVYPDVKQQVLYVGGYDAYRKFEKYRYEQNAAQEDLNASEMGDWGMWGPWGGPGWY
jgi:hypothetical protein